MTAINLDDQVVASSYDSATRICSYTYQHSDGSRYTVKVPLDDLNKHGPMPLTRQQRRTQLATTIMNHIHANPPDDVDG